MAEQNEDDFLTLTIQKESDYTKFAMVAGNREVRPEKVRVLKRNIEKHDYTRSNPIVVNSSKDGKPMAIMDGQHRFTVCQLLGLPIYYIVDDNITINDVAALNHGRANWITADYLRNYVNQSNENYLQFQEFILKYDIIGSHEAFVVLKASGNKMSTRRHFQDGTFEFPTDEQMVLVEKFIEDARKLSKFVELPLKRHRNKTASVKNVANWSFRPVVMATEGLYLTERLTKMPGRIVPVFSWDHMWKRLDALQEEDQKIRAPKTGAELISALSEIYNKSMRKNKSMVDFAKV